MTIDITIGKLRIKTVEEVIKNELKEIYKINNESRFRITDFVEIEQCPDEEDGCTEEDTIFPNSAYRSGSISGMCDFFRNVIPNLIRKIRIIETNDTQYTKIKPFLEEINRIQYDGNDLQHKRRLHWLKFWCNKSVELYSDDAVIMFS